MTIRNSIRASALSASALKSIAAGTLVLAAITGSPALAQDAPPLVKQLNNGNWLPQTEAEALRDELFYQRAIHAYMTMIPALNTVGMRDGAEAAFGKGYNVLPIWKDRMDSRAWIPTPNGDVIYSLTFLDLKETGPLVVAAPPNERHRHVHRSLPAHHYGCWRNRSGSRARRALSAAAPGL
jgi:hypothetical protein